MTTHRNILLTLLVSLTLSSCNLLGPVDDIQPDFVLTDDDVITDSNSAEYLLNGIYSRYRERSLASMRNGMFILTGTLNNTTVAEGATNFRENNLRPQNNTVLNYYTGLYAIINQSNSLIANLRDAHPKGLTEARKGEILGEAYFHKAFAEFMLLRSFGEFWDRSSDYGVVLYNEPARGNDEAKRRAPVEECYTQILSDLDEAVAAPAYDGRAYRVNGVTVQMLRARVLLYMGRFADAAATARTAIADATAGGASLETDYLTVFAQGFSSPETLFAPYVSYPLETMGSILTTDVNLGYGTTVSRIADELAGTTGDELYDARYTAAFQPMSLKKYVLNNATTGDNNTYYFMRLPELYLILAEAEAREGNYPQAREALQPVATRAGYAEDYADGIADGDLLLTIFRHKYMELSAENYEEWYDMVRYYRLDGTDFTATGLGYTQSMQHLVLPIPTQALSGNSLLVQNPTYEISNH